MKTKLTNVEFMRAFCAIGVVVYHFSHYSFCPHKIFLNYANGLWGEAVVIVFFALSGAMLYLNNREISSLKTFYFKRFKAVFPMFYIAFLIFFTKNAIAAKTLFYRGDCSPWTLLLTLFGMDGYLRYIGVNYYILGEWFLGAIILCYLFYPLLVKGIDKLPAVTSIIVAGLFIWVQLHNIFVIDTFRNLFSCIFAFYLGMIFFKYKKILELNISFAVSAAAILLLWLIELPITQTISQHIMGYALFIVLFRVGQWVCKVKLFERLSLAVGKLSYPIFLLQAVFVQDMLMIKNPLTGKKMCAWMLITVLVIIFFSWLLQLLTNWILKSKPCKALDKALIK